MPKKSSKIRGCSAAVISTFRLKAQEDISFQQIAMWVDDVIVWWYRNPDTTTERNEEEEFAKGPLSILYNAVKNNTQVESFGLLFYGVGADQRA